MSRGRPTFTESIRAIVLISSQARRKSKHISAGTDNPAFDRASNRERETQAEIRRSTEYPVEALMSAATPYRLRFLVGVWQLRNLRKSIGDVEPRRLACDKAVERRPHVRDVVEYA